MSYLRDLVSYVVNGPELRRIRFDELSPPHTKTAHLFSEIASGSNLKEAGQKIYGISDHSHKLHELKSRLVDKLVDSIYSTSPSASILGNAYLNNFRRFTVARELTLNGHDSGAHLLYKKVFNNAEIHGFSDLAFHSSKEMVRFYSFQEQNNSRREYYQNRVKFHLKNLNAESAVEELHQEILGQHSKSQSRLDKSKLNHLVGITRKFEQQLKELNSFEFVRRTHLCLIMIAELEGEMGYAIKKCYNAISALESRRIPSPSAITSFKIRLISCLTKASRYDEAFEVSEDYFANRPRSLFTHLVLLFYYFILCIQSQSYQKALLVLLEAREVPSFRKLPQNLKQLWTINEAYVHLLIKSGKIDVAKHPEIDARKFRLYKFLNEVPIYTKDKRGVNIAILILHIMFLLEARKYGKIHDRVAALEQYSYRYLRKDDTFRSNCFIKMLIQMPKANFNRIRTERYAEPYFNKLQAMPENEKRQNIEMEVMPYEHLWALALDMLN